MKADKAKILIIDDEPGMREGMRRLLEANGFHADTACTGEQGVSLGLETEYDLYFVDLKMPDMDGVEVLRAIKLAHPDSICIVMTAFASIDSAVVTTRLGAYRYIPKPFDPDELLHLVQTALGRRALILETRRLKNERERQMLELSREQSRLRTIISALDDGILVVNQNLDAVLFNNSFLAHLELSGNLKIGSSVENILPETIFQQIREIVQMKRTIKAVKQEIIIRPPAEKVVMFNTTPIRDDAGNLIGVVSVVRDISELKKIDIMRSQFVNMAAHELKAPLSAVQGYLEILTDSTLNTSPELAQKYLTRSLERTKALVSLINDLLNISRMEAGTVRRQIEPIELESLLSEIVESMQAGIKAKNLTVTTQFSGRAVLSADKNEMARLFKHLIGNAVKYNRPDGEIRIEARVDGHFMCISIADTGIGVTEEEKARLFEDFFRAKNKYTRSITGTGLGLSIAKKIVDTYHGRIDVESQFEKGSTFTIKLPLANNSEP